MNPTVSDNGRYVEVSNIRIRGVSESVQYPGFRDKLNSVVLKSIPELDYRGNDQLM